MGGNAYRSYDYVLNENGSSVSYGSRAEDFLVDVVAHKASDLIRRSAADGTPFFIYVAPFTPHGPPPRHPGTSRSLRTPNCRVHRPSTKPT